MNDNDRHDDEFDWDDVGASPFQPVYVFLAAMIAACILIAVVLLFAWPAAS